MLVELDDVVDGSVGRPSRPLDIAPDLGVFLGVKLTGGRVYAVATDIRAEPLAWHEEALDARDPESVVAQLVSVAARLPAAVGIGVSLGGTVHGGIVHEAPFLGWGRIDLAARLQEVFPVPVAVENDLVALTEAERWFGAGRGLAGFMTVTIGAGVGYGLVIDGNVVRTPDAAGGTGGHIPLDPFGPVCMEGHRGCAQAMLASGSISAQVSAALGRSVDYDEALALAADGEHAARAVVGAAGDALGRLIALGANLSLQSAVVLAGEGVGLYPLVADRVRAAIAAGRAPAAEPIAIHVDESGFRAWARGAAAVAIQSAMDRMRVAR